MSLSAGYCRLLLDGFAGLFGRKKHCHGGGLSAILDRGSLKQQQCRRLDGKHGFLPGI